MLMGKHTGRKLQTALQIASLDQGVMRTHVALLGMAGIVPVFNAVSMYHPGGAMFAFGGAATLTCHAPPAAAVMLVDVTKASSLWPMELEWEVKVGAYKLISTDVGGEVEGVVNVTTKVELSFTLVEIGEVMVSLWGS